MNKDNLILKDGTIIELESGASLSDMKVLFVDQASMINTWNVLTSDNLSEVQIKNGDGVVIANYTDLVLISETSIVNEDGTILTSFNLREKTDIEKQLEQLAAQTEQNTVDIEQNAANLDYLAMESGVEL